MVPTSGKANGDFWYGYLKLQKSGFIPRGMRKFNTKQIHIIELLAYYYILCRDLKILERHAFLSLNTYIYIIKYIYIYLINVCTHGTQIVSLFFWYLGGFDPWKKKTPLSNGGWKAIPTKMHVYGCVSKNRGVYPPKSSILIGCFHYFHHPFWWVSHYFWKHPNIATEDWKLAKTSLQESLPPAEIHAWWNQIMVQLGQKKKHNNFDVGGEPTVDLWSLGWSWCIITKIKLLPWISIRYWQTHVYIELYCVYI